jgi:hypothetical protein
MVYHQIWLIFLLAPLCLYYKTKQKKKKQKNKEKKHWFQGMGAGRKKGSC